MNECLCFDLANCAIIPQLDMENHLIGEEILSLAESDVPAEDVVFHKFYMNKMISNKKSKKKKKKKAADEEAADELYDINDQGDESDNEEIEEMLDSSNPPEPDGGDYDYDDLENIAADEDDDDLIGKESNDDKHIDILSDLSGAESEEDAEINFYEEHDIPEEEEDNDDSDDDSNNHHQKKRKRKQNFERKTTKSPFASIEEYEHLINEDNNPEAKSKHRNNNKPNTKNKKKNTSR